MGGRRLEDDTPSNCLSPSAIEEGGFLNISTLSTANKSYCLSPGGRSEGLEELESKGHMSTSTCASSMIDASCCPLFGGGGGSVKENVRHQPSPMQNTDVGASSMTNVYHHLMTGGGGGVMVSVKGNR